MIGENNMKLRNKKTGEIESVSIDTFGVDGKDRRIGISVVDFSSPSDYRCIASYSSLAKLNEEWEDYKPTEPLIKDEKIRKAVRAWAEVNSVDTVLYAERPNRSLWCLTDMGDDDYSIGFVGWMPTLKDSDEYTITELCGGEQ
jgi:hypothetical protein